MNVVLRYPRISVESISLLFLQTIMLSSILSASAGKVSSFSIRAMATTATVGSKIPLNITLLESNPGNKVVLESIFANKKVVMIGVPGAFTPTCSNQHLPSIVSNFDKFKAKGVDELVCVSVNDPFVMGEWGKAQHADGKVRMLADVNGELTSALGLEFDLNQVFGTKAGFRCKRFSCVVENGVIKYLNIQPPGGDAECTFAPNLLNVL